LRGQVGHAYAKAHGSEALGGCQPNAAGRAGDDGNATRCECGMFGHSGSPFSFGDMLFSM
jgi:hypothetical protein